MSVGGVGQPRDISAMQGTAAPAEAKKSNVPEKADGNISKSVELLRGATEKEANAIAKDIGKNISDALEKGSAEDKAKALKDGAAAIASIDSKTSSAEGVLKRTQGEHESASKELVGEKANLAKGKEALDKLTQGSTAKQQELQGKKDEKAAIEETIRDTQFEITGLEEKVALLEQIPASDGQYKSAQGDIQTLKDEIGEKRGKLGDQEEKLGTVDEEIEQLQFEATQLQGDVELVQGHVNQMEAKVGKLEGKVEELEGKIDAYTKYSSDLQVAKSAIETPVLKLDKADVEAFDKLTAAYASNITDTGNVQGTKEAAPTARAEAKPKASELKGRTSDLTGKVGKFLRDNPNLVKTGMQAASQMAPAVGKAALTALFALPLMLFLGPIGLLMGGKMIADSMGELGKAGGQTMQGIGNMVQNSAMEKLAGRLSNIGKEVQTQESLGEVQEEEWADEEEEELPTTKGGQTAAESAAAARSTHDPGKALSNFAKADFDKMSDEELEGLAKELEANISPRGKATLDRNASIDDQLSHQAYSDPSDPQFKKGELEQTDRVLQGTARDIRAHIQARNGELTREVPSGQGMTERVPVTPEETGKNLKAIQEQVGGAGKPMRPPRPSTASTAGAASKPVQQSPANAPAEEEAEIEVLKKDAAPNSKPDLGKLQGDWKANAQRNSFDGNDQMLRELIGNKDVSDAELGEFMKGVGVRNEGGFMVQKETGQLTGTGRLLKQQRPALGAQVQPQKPDLGAAQKQWEANAGRKDAGANYNLLSNLASNPKCSDQEVLGFMNKNGVRSDGGFMKTKDGGPTALKSLIENKRPEIPKEFNSKQTAQGAPVKAQDAVKGTPHMQRSYSTQTSIEQQKKDHESAKGFLKDNLAKVGGSVEFVKAQKPPAETDPSKVQVKKDLDGEVFSFSYTSGVNGDIKADGNRKEDNVVIYGVASQFNGCESPGKEVVKPGNAVNVYKGDRTQGPQAQLAFSAEQVETINAGGNRGFNGLVGVLDGDTKTAVQNGYLTPNREQADGFIKQLESGSVEYLCVGNKPEGGSKEVHQVMVSAAAFGGYNDVENPVTEEQQDRIEYLCAEKAYSAQFEQAINIAKESGKPVVLKPAAIGVGAFGNKPENVEKAFYSAAKKYEGDLKASGVKVEFQVYRGASGPNAEANAMRENLGLQKA